MRYIVLPQALRKVMPPMANQFITLIKDSSIISLISVQELTYKTVELVASTRMIFEAWITTAAFYFVICFGLSMLFRRLEQPRRVKSTPRTARRCGGRWRRNDRRGRDRGRRPDGPWHRREYPEGRVALLVPRSSGQSPDRRSARAGAQAVDTGRALAERSDVVILCVTGSPQVEDVLTRKDGVLAGLRPGATVIDCSTAIPASTQAMAAFRGGGGALLDAPMTRTPKEAAEGRLNLIVGGDAALLEEHRPLLDSFARTSCTRAGSAPDTR